MPLIDMVMTSFLDNIFSDLSEKQKVSEDNPTLFFITSFLTTIRLQLVTMYLLGTLGLSVVPVTV